MTKLTLTSIHIEEDGGIDGDNVVIRVQCDGGAPVRFPILETHFMNNDSDDWGLSPNPVYYFNHTCYVSLWDRDADLFNLTEDDFLGDCYFSPNDVGTTDTHRSVYGSDEAHYHVYFSISDDDLPTADSELPQTPLVEAAQTALTSWENSTEGKEVISYTDPQSVFEIVADALISTAFEDVITEAKNHIKIKAVSLGLMGDIDIFGGINAGFGAVLDITKDGAEAVMYAGGGITEGVDEGFDGGIAVGLWYQEISDIGGVYFGGEVMVDDGLGFDGAAFCARDDSDDYRNAEDAEENPGKINADNLKMSFISISLGEGGGGDAEEAYFFAGDVGADMPCYQTGDFKYTVRINTIKCIKAESQGSDNDCVKIVWSPDYEYTNLPSGPTNNFVYPMVNSIEMDDDTSGNIQTKHPGTIVRFQDSINFGFYEGKGSEGISSLDFQTVQVSNFTTADEAAVGDTCWVEFMNGDSESNSSIAYKLQLEVVAVSSSDDS